MHSSLTHTENGRVLRRIHIQPDNVRGLSLNCGPLVAMTGPTGGASVAPAATLAAWSTCSNRARPPSLRQVRCVIPSSWPLRRLAQDPRLFVRSVSARFASLTPWVQPGYARLFETLPPPRNRWPPGLQVDLGFDQLSPSANADLRRARARRPTAMLAIAPSGSVPHEVPG
jgi:hypothetical protein